jgi:Lon protease-like protein
VAETRRELPLFPLERVVLFPGMALPLHIFEPRYRAMIGMCEVTDRLFGVVLIRSGREVGASAETETVGCTARITQLERLPDGRMHLVAVGEDRFKLLETPRSSPDGYLIADAAILPTEEEKTVSVPDELVARLAEQFQAYRALLLQMAGQGEARTPPELPRDGASLSYLVGASLRLPPRERQRLLEENDVGRRLRQALRLLRRENQAIRLMAGAKGADKTIGPFSIN